MDDQNALQQTQEGNSANWAVAVSVLLFVAIYLTGFIKGLAELSQRTATE